VKAGVDAWQQGDYARAIATWRPLATSGDADAQFNLAQAYKLGRGVPADVPAAMLWFRKASEQGHERATDNLGFLLFQQGKRDEAMPLIRASSDRGDPRAQYILATAMFNGDSVAKDWVMAYALMTRSASSGLEQAQSSLAVMDKYIATDQRQKGLAIAADMARAAAAPQYAAASPAPAAAPAPASKPSSPVSPEKAGTPPVREASGPSPRRPSAPPGVTPPASPEAAVSANVAPPQRAGAPPGLPPAPKPLATAMRPTTQISQEKAAPRKTAPDKSAKATAPPRATAPPTASPPSAPARASPPTSLAMAKPASSSGAWRIQMGAFREEPRAKALWQNATTRISALGGYKLFLIRTGDVTRLQAGPLRNQNDAAKLCGQVRAGGYDCLVKEM
jgi:cell division septation protein DedD